MSTPDFFRSRVDQMIDLRHPLAVLSSRLPWAAIEAAVAPKLAHQAKPPTRVAGVDLAGAFDGEFGGGVRAAGCPRLPVRLMASLLCLKHSFNLSDEELVERWAKNVQWQFFSGMDYYEPRLPCDATQIGRFRRLLGEDGIEQLLKATIDCAVQIKAVRPAELERVIVDSTVQEKAIAHPVDSRLLEIARHKVVNAAKRAGIGLKQTYAQESKTLRRKAGGYAHAKQFKRPARTIRRQRTILGVVMREVQRKLDADKAADGAPVHEPGRAKAISDLLMWQERAERIRTQQRNSKDKLYALHAPEPLIDHTKSDHRMDRCWLRGALGDALHALSCAVGYNTRLLLWAIARLGLVVLFYALSTVVAWGLSMLRVLRIDPKAPRSSSRPQGIAGSGVV